MTRSVKTPAALAALNDWLELFAPETRKRGIDYLLNDHVSEVWAEADHYVIAVVEGGETYDVTLFLTRGNWSAECSCPLGGDCKHVYAAGKAWIAAVESGLADQQEIKPMTAHIPSWNVAVPVPEKKRKSPSFRERWAPVLAEKLGRELTEAEGRQLGQLSALFTEFAQGYNTLYPAAVRRHGFGGLIPHQPEHYDPLYRGWWPPSDPPRDPWALWQYLAYDAERHGREIPEAFRAMTDTAAVAAKVGHMLLQEELGAWRRALAREAEREADAGAAPKFSGLRGRLDPRGELFIEMQQTPQTAWRSPGQDWYRELGNAHPADFDHLPRAEAALAVTLAWECNTAYYGFAAKRAVPPEVAARLLSGAAAGAVVMADGSPFTVQAEPLVREAVAVAGERLQMQLVAPDGRRVEEPLLVASRPVPLYLHAGRVWRGPPPLPVTTLPKAALADPGIMSGLRKSGLRLPASLEVKIQHVTLRPKLKAWLAEPTHAFAGEVLEVVLTAAAEDPPCAQIWNGEGGWRWQENAEPPARGRDGAFLEFDLRPAQETAGRFADFGLRWASWAQNWQRPVTRSFAEDFVAWHATLPSGVDVELSPELAGLIDAPLRARVDFSALPAGPGHDWFDLTVALRVEDTTLSADEIALLLKARGKWVRLARHGWRRLEVAADAGVESAAALDRLGLGAADVLATGKATTHRMHALQLASEAGTFEARDARLAAALRERAEKLAAVPRPALPPGLRATLRPYQEEGFHFLGHLSANGFGGVLADDMGLGKTVQTLAWLLHLRTEAGGSSALPFRALVVCPKSVTHGWLAETARFAPELRAVNFVPALTERKAETLEAELVVANYTQLRLNAAWFQAATWDAVVLDEGQFIKNPTSQAAVVARSLRTNRRLVLTGTPVENRLTDLWSLFAFAQPGLLGAQAAFKRQYPENEDAALARLRRRVGHFLLRRTKAQAAPDLPPRTEDELVVELEGGQRKLYDAELKRARAQLLGVKTDRALDKVRFNILASLLRLRQICCHPALIDSAHRDLPSAKLEALMERLEELGEEGHQVLVFSQFVEMLEIIRERLLAAGIGHLVLTGATENRAALVEEFQRDRTKTVFLLSLKAAGFGLNLTAASYAILYDPWWNPAVEAQAIDRTHRIGQTKPVMAYRLLAENTIERKIRALQQEKSALAASVVQEESLAKVMDLESLRRILG